jgi:Nif-specific regulatory protein
MTPRLLAVSGTLAGATWTLTQTETTLGREPGNHLSLPDPLVSRQHCCITQAADQFQLRDLGSANGSFVNGLPIKERTLQHGDLIKLGDSLLLFLCQPEPAAGEAIAPTSGVRFEESQLGAQATLTLRREESRYLGLEHWLLGSPVTARLAREFQALLQIGLELNALRNVAALQQRLLELICTVVPAERGAILLLDEGAGEFVSAFGWERAGQQDVQVSRTIVQRVVREGVALLCNDVPAQSEFQQAPSLLYAGVQSIIAAPLAAGTRVFGVIYLDTNNAAAGFDEAHLQLVTAMANLSAAAFDNARQLEQLSAETWALRAQLTGDRALIGESELMQRVRDFIAKVAPAPSTVLLRGESGTGKEIVAHALHQNSPRANQPFVAINCAVLTDTLLESELFGHEKGAFTGAIAQKKGKLELAAGGTVFLDEIGELAPPLQAKLLRVLQERECERVGGTRPIKLDIRLLAATNKDLEAAIQDGSFRADLYYRLNVFTLTLPPLRERRDDIPLLAAYFVNHFAEQAGKRLKGMAPAARQCLLNYDWPGNVRELQNALERAVVLCSTDFILPEDLPDNVAEADKPLALAPTLQAPPAYAAPTEPLPLTTPTSYRDAVKAARKQIILNAFVQAQYSHQAAAKLLGLHPNNLHRELSRLNLRDLLKGR